MKIKNQHTKRKALYIAIISSVLVLGLALTGWALYGDTILRQLRPQSTSSGSSSTDQEYIDSEAPTDEQKQAGDGIKESSLETNNSSQSASVGVVITSAAVSGDSFTVRAYVNTVTSSGTCTLTLSEGSNVITRTSSVTPGPSISGCETFTVPTSELYTGTWDVRVSFAGDSRTGTGSTTAEITL